MLSECGMKRFIAHFLSYAFLAVLATILACSGGVFFGYGGSVATTRQPSVHRARPALLTTAPMGVTAETPPPPRLVRARPTAARARAVKEGFAGLSARAPATFAAPAIDRRPTGACELGDGAASAFSEGRS